MKSKDIIVGREYLLSETGSYPHRRHVRVIAVGVERKVRGSAYSSATAKDGIQVRVLPVPEHPAFDEWTWTSGGGLWLSGTDFVVRPQEIARDWDNDLVEQFKRDHANEARARQRGHDEKVRREGLVTRVGQRFPTASVTGYNPGFISIDVATVEKLLDVYDGWETTNT